MRKLVLERRGKVRVIVFEVNLEEVEFALFEVEVVGFHDQIAGFDVKILEHLVFGNEIVDEVDEIEVAKVGIDIPFAKSDNLVEVVDSDVVGNMGVTMAETLFDIVVGELQTDMV